MHTALTAVILSATLAVGVAGCSTHLGDDHQGGMMSESSEHSSAFDMQDVMFAQMMIPHHEQAVELATLAETHTTTPAILDLAARIKAAQQPEIDQMKGWLTAAGADKPAMDEMPMQGIVSDSDMAKLDQASGKAFDKLFLSRMIAHHQGAITMAKDVLGSTTNNEVSALAHTIIESQTAEIVEMQKLLAGY